ncbi:MAG: TldD/PmbA family protein [Anaerolineaceae bacterium]|nr:TldD/PmbA family protein [Anaerolineaceae bacterium]
MKKAFEIKDKAILEVAEQILAEIKAIGADEGECWVSRNALTELYYELGKISMIRTVFTDNVSIKLLKDQRKGTVSLNSFEPVEIKQAVTEAWQAAQSATADEAEGIAELQENLSFSSGEPKPDLDKMYKQLEDLLTDCKKDYPLISFDSIGVEHNASERLYANSNGVRLSEEGGNYQLSEMFMGKEGDNSSSFNYASTIYNDPSERFTDSERIRRLFEETEKQIHTEQFEGSFVGDLVITPGCLENFAWYIIEGCLSDTALISGTSPWKDKLGQQVANPLFNFSLAIESDELPGGSVLNRDGYVAEEMDLIKNGVLTNFVLSRYGAAKTGLARSANINSTLVINNGDTPLGEMIAGVERGVLLGRFSGGEPSPSGDFSGVAKNSFLIENGKVSKALSEVMIAGNLGNLLRDTVAVSKERENSGYWLLPWLHSKNITISGK